MLRQQDVLEYLIRMGPGRSERELAEAIHGDDAYQQLVNQDCRALENLRRVERHGFGGRNDVYRYYPLGSETMPSSVSR